MCGTDIFYLLIIFYSKRQVGHVNEKISANSWEDAKSAEHLGQLLNKEADTTKTQNSLYNHSYIHPQHNDHFETNSVVRE